MELKLFSDLPDTSDADEWITDQIFRVGDKYYAITASWDVRELTSCELAQLLAKIAPAKSEG